MRVLFSVALFALASTSLAHADAVEDALEAARSAYASGDLSGTAAQINAAARAVLELQAGRLQAMLPEPPSGWTREIDEANDGGMLLSGIVGTTVSARYGRNGEEFTLTLTADSPLVAQMAGMLGNLQMMSMLGKIRKIGGQDMLEQDGALSALAGSRVLVQARGMNVDTMGEVLSQIDFAKLPDYDK